MITIVLALAVPDGSGAPRMAYFFGRALVKEGYRVIAACGNGAVHDGVPTGARIRFMDELRAAGMEIVDMPSVYSPLARHAPTELAALFRREHVRVAIGFQPRDQLAVLRAVAKSPTLCIISAQTLLRFWGRWPVPALKASLFGYFLRRSARLVVCTSSQVQAEYVNDYGVPASRTCVVPNGIPLSETPFLSAGERQEIRNEFGCRSDEHFLVNVGRIDPQKGQDLLLEALGQLTRNGKYRPRLVLIGDVSAGSAYPQILEAYRRSLDVIIDKYQLGKRVVFAGWRHDVPRLLAAADAYVHSARYEGLPLAVLEALWAGRPTLFTDCCGEMPGFQSGVHAIRVRPDDVPSLREGLEQLLALPEADRIAMGNAGKELVRDVFDIDLVSAAFVEAVTSVLA